METRAGGHAALLRRPAPQDCLLLHLALLLLLLLLCLLFLLQGCRGRRCGLLLL